MANIKKYHTEERRVKAKKRHNAKYHKVNKEKIKERKRLNYLKKKESLSGICEIDIIVKTKTNKKKRTKKYKTEEERQDAKKKSVAKYHKSNKKKINERKKANYLKNKDSISEKYYNSITKYVVYKHTNSKGEIYIGSGNNHRPNYFRNRPEAWVNAFKDECEVTIIAEFTDRNEAFLAEEKILRDIGLDNLINQHFVQWV